ncbi:MAG: hypothetical protein FWC80_01165 [Firmicutes bacterium]|nr:hypothetical protein [Bacillota bacterium]
MWTGAVGTQVGAGVHDRPNGKNQCCSIRVNLGGWRSAPTKGYDCRWVGRYSLDTGRGKHCSPEYLTL